MSKPTNVTVSVVMDEEQLNTLQVYLLQGEKSLEAILKETVSDTLAKLYAKHVPQAVQNFLSLKNGAPVIKADMPKPVKKSREKKGNVPDNHELLIIKTENSKPAIL